MRRTLLALLMAVATMLAAALPAAATGGSTWPTARGDGMAVHQADTAGPVSPTLKWLTAGEDIGGWQVDGSNAGTDGEFDDLVLTPQGDVLVLASREIDDDRKEGLLALDGQTGELNWTVGDVVDHCKPAVDAEGHVWQLLQLHDHLGNRAPEDHPDATRVLVEIDPADGTLTGNRYSGDNAALGSRACPKNGLQIGADDTLLLFDRAEGTKPGETFDGFNLHRIRAIDPVDGSENWMRTYSNECKPSRWLWTPPAGAPNANRVYLSFDTGNSDCRHTDSKMVALDLDTGGEVDEVDLPGPVTRFRKPQLVDDDGNLYVGQDLYRPNDEQRLTHLLRLSDDGNNLAVDWVLTGDEKADDRDCAVELCTKLSSLSVAGDQLTGLRGGDLVGIDATTGEMNWTTEVDPHKDDIVTDADGNTYVTGLSGSSGVKLASIGADGEVLGEIHADDGVGSIRTLGPLGPDGLLYGRFDNSWFALEPEEEPPPTIEPPPSDATACDDQDVPSSGFADIAGNTHEDAIECIVWYGVTQGVAPDRYGPAGQVNRGQMASFIARAMTAADYTLPASSGQGFSDVAGNTHETAINQLAAAGVVQGTSSTTYSPSLPVNRAQMASFLVRAYETMEDPLPTGDSGFADTVGNTHEDNINKAAEAGFALGTSATTYSPSAPVRRDQMGSFLTRMLERLAADGRLTPPTTEGRDTTEEVPEPLEVIEQGGQYWAVLWVGEFGDPALDQVRDAIDQRWGPVWSDGEVGCNDGAAEALNVDPNARAVSVHFGTEADAAQFAEHADLQAEPTGYAEVTTFCLD